MRSADTTNLDGVTNAGRGRPSDYTQAEDEIILNVTDTKQCQRLLREAGFSERTPAAIWSRRDHLRRAGYTEADVGALPEPEEARILFARRAKLQERLRNLEAQVSELRDEIDHLTERIRRLV